MKRFGVWSAANRRLIYACSISSSADSSISNFVKRRWHTLLLVSALVSFVPSIAIADVVISEFMAANDTTLFDEDGDDEDWIELHNTGAWSASS